MASPFQILSRSAVPETIKVSTAVNEILRRWKTTSKECGQEVFREITLDYMDMLAANGYGEPWRRNVLQKALTGYMRILTACKAGTTTRNRKGASTLGMRRVKKLCGKTLWYQELKEEEEEDVEQRFPSSSVSSNKHIGNGGKKHNKGRNLVESVMFILYTTGGKLKSELTKMEQNQPYDRKIKFVEKMGLTLNNILCKKDPVSGHCGRECFLCDKKLGGVA